MNIRTTFRTLIIVAELEELLFAPRDGPRLFRAEGGKVAVVYFKASMAIHIGLIGGGNITETHARAVRAIPGAEIAAIHGTNSAKLDALCLEYGGTPYRDFDAFLAHRPLDMVAIGSPSGLHATQGIAAADRGLHVLTEKPVDINTERADALVDAAERNQVKLGVMFQDRVKPGIRQLKDWIDAGVVGKVLLADARVKWYRPPEYYSQSRWRGTLALDGGGALINQAIHTVDLLLWLLGDVTRVQSRSATALHKIEAEDTALAILEFSSGALGVFQATTAAYPGYPRRVEVTGTEGTVILEHDRILAANLQDPPPGFSEGAVTDANQSATSAVVSDFRGHQSLFEDFIHAIESDSTPICDGRDGRRSIALVEAIYRAARSKAGGLAAPPGSWLHPEWPSGREGSGAERNVTSRRHYADARRVLRKLRMTAWKKLSSGSQ